MLAWDPEAVASILGVQPVFEDNSSYRYAFTTYGVPAVLRVFPYSGDIELDIGKAEEPWATWRLNCTAITYNKEIPEEGGPSLVFRPASSVGKHTHPSHWMILGPSENGIDILTVFRQPEAQ